jgi:hypothetical protein
LTSIFWELVVPRTLSDAQGLKCKNNKSALDSRWGQKQSEQAQALKIAHFVVFFNPMELKPSLFLL